MKNITSLQPRNGHIIVRLIRAEQSLLTLPDGAKNPTIADRIEIVALAPDIPLTPRSNEPMFRVGDAIIGLPGQNIIQLADEDLGVIHYTAVVAIER